MNLRDRLKQVMEFDEHQTADDARARVKIIGERPTLAIQCEAVRWEHRRLSPLHTQLLKCVEALEQVKNLKRSTAGDYQAEMHENRRSLSRSLIIVTDALADLEAVVKTLEDGK